jgi:hypothetical protein
VPAPADSGCAVGAGIAEHDVVACDGVAGAALDLVDHDLELVVGEPLDLAAVVADQMVMVLAAGQRRLVAGDARADVDPQQPIVSVSATPPARARARLHSPARPGRRRRLREPVRGGDRERAPPAAPVRPGGTAGPPPPARPADRQGNLPKRHRRPDEPPARSRCDHSRSRAEGARPASPISHHARFYEGAALSAAPCSTPGRTTSRTA